MPNCLVPTKKLGSSRLEIEVEQLLRKLQMPGKLNGIQYLRDAIVSDISQPGRTQFITKELYPELAKIHGTTSQRVERAIRHAIEVCWKCGDRKLLDQIAGFPLKKRPTNSQFIDLISFYFRSR